jgi:flagella basal body P-ring formation protein FlgA
VLAAAAAASSGSIRVQAQATVSGGVVQLADVATLDGAARDLATVALGEAPAPGASRRFSGHEVLSRLRAAGLDEAIAYHIPVAVSVTRASQALGDAELRPLVTAALEERLPPGDRVEAVEIGRPVRIGVGDYEVRVGEPETRSTGGGNRRVQVTVLQDGAAVATLPVRVKLATFGSVVVARHALGRGVVLGADDVRLEARRIDDLPPSVLTSIEDAIGKETRVALGPGRPLTAQALAATPLVQRGDAVRLVIETGGLRLSASGEALDTAGAGERVRVVNSNSRREIVGRVIAHGTVAVSY